MVDPEHLAVHAVVWTHGPTGEPLKPGSIAIPCSDGSCAVLVFEGE